MWGIQSDDGDGEDDVIVVRNRCMRQQSGERWNEMEDIDNHDNDDDEEGKDHEEDVAEHELESQMPPELPIIVIDISLSRFSCLEDC